MSNPKNVYRVGLGQIQEAVISSHFMHEMCTDSRFQLYDDHQFATKCLTIDDSVIDNVLIPALLTACKEFARSRAMLAKQRAAENYKLYGLRDRHETGPAEFITEVMFDRHYQRGPRETCARDLLRDKIKERMDGEAPIAMAIPALPFKISCPLKSRGALPDLAEVNFILCLLEIALSIELLYREACPKSGGKLAKFTVVSDGSRFDELVAEHKGRAGTYRAELTHWIERLGLDGYIELLDYSTLLCHRLPNIERKAKRSIRNKARRQYARTMWPIFDPNDMAKTLDMAARSDPDPESSNAEGRFVSLLKSLVFTINYSALASFVSLPVAQYRALYREMTGHIFEPYHTLSPRELCREGESMGQFTEFPKTARAKECLRREMLKEVWKATIEYIAEIKSDRELESEPILSCLPGHLRWTIHAKPGQLALLTPTALGKPVQAWAGAAVFKLTSKKAIKLCTLPVLALEGAGAIPVKGGHRQDTEQPLFYIYPDVTFADLNEFLDKVGRTLVRKRIRC